MHVQYLLVNSGVSVTCFLLTSDEGWFVSVVNSTDLFRLSQASEISMDASDWPVAFGCSMILNFMAKVIKGQIDSYNMWMQSCAQSASLASKEETDDVASKHVETHF